MPDNYSCRAYTKTAAINRHGLYIRPCITYSDGKFGSSRGVGSIFSRRAGGFLSAWHPLADLRQSAERIATLFFCGRAEVRCIPVAHSLSSARTLIADGRAWRARKDSNPSLQVRSLLLCPVELRTPREGGILSQEGQVRMHDAGWQPSLALPGHPAAAAQESVDPPNKMQQAR
jgi:hypothetical protein